MSEDKQEKKPYEAPRFAIKPDKLDEWRKGWDSNAESGYGMAGYSFVQGWGEAMDKALAAGESIADCADRACSEADKDIGITGFMYGLAVQMLSAWWEHGEELLRWHNRQYIKDQAKADEATDRGSCVNPAIFTIGEK